MGDLPQLPMRVFRAVVVRVVDLGPGLRRVVLGGPGLVDFATTGVGDEYVRVLFAAKGESEPRLPEVVNGVFDYDAVDLKLLRTYTIRAFDPGAGEVTVDFVLHGHGVATTWARSAKPGDVVGLNTPTGMYDPPADMAWQILVCDLAGLPALARIVEQTPPEVRTRAVVEVPDEHHRLELPAHPRAEVTWTYGGNGHAPSMLEEIVRSLPRPTDPCGYTWVSGETRTLRGVRHYLRRELGMPASAYKAVGYWTDRAEEWNARYAAVDAATRSSLEALWDSDLAEDEIEYEYDRRLAALGL
jgi:NADPH-dependent ferric siderophore reductase